MEECFQAEISSPFSPTIAMGFSTSTSASASCRMASNSPAAVDSTSKVALSVSTSQRISPAEMGSPSCFFHSIMMHDSTDCPWRGMRISEAIISFLLCGFNNANMRFLESLFFGEMKVRVGNQNISFFIGYNACKAG